MPTNRLSINSLEQLRTEIHSSPEAENIALFYPEPKSFSRWLASHLPLEIISLLTPLPEESFVKVSRAEVVKHIDDAQSISDLLTQLGIARPSENCPANWTVIAEDLPVLEPGTARMELQDHETEILNCGTSKSLKLNTNSSDYQALLAGFYQWYNDLDRSHEYSQAVQHEGENRAGDYWHAIMHRREGDYSNAKYWFRHVGTHPIYPELANTTEQIAEQFGGDIATQAKALYAGGNWNAPKFVEYCSNAGANTAQDRFARCVQAAEMVLLMKQTLEDCQE